MAACKDHGEVRLEGEKYIEIPMQASVQIFENIKVDFTWKLDGDIFTQSGTIVRPDGKLIVLEALKFRRVGDTKPNTKNPGIGTWKQVSGHYTNADGQQTSAFNEAQKRFLVVTPTHFMRMDHTNEEFNGVTFGTYDLKGDSIITVPYFSTYTSDSAGSTANATRQRRGSAGTANSQPRVASAVGSGISPASSACASRISLRRSNQRKAAPKGTASSSGQRAENVRSVLRTSARGA